MIGQPSSRGLWIVVVGLAVFGGAAPRLASAQQWHELYTGGLAALRKGQAPRAVELLKRAIEERPQPGVQVPTYAEEFSKDPGQCERLLWAFKRGE